MRSWLPVVACFTVGKRLVSLYVEAGSTFKTGDPLFIVEVMKMFNKVNAPFDGRLTSLVEGDGVIIKKGQPSSE